MVGIPGRRMHHHACGFVDDDNGVIFVNDIQRHVLRNGFRFHRRLFGQNNHIAFFEMLADFGNFVVDQHVAFLDGVLDLRTRKRRFALRKKYIQPLPALAFVYRKFYFFRLTGQITTPYYISSLPRWLQRSLGVEVLGDFNLLFQSNNSIQPKFFSRRDSLTSSKLNSSGAK